MFLVNEIVRDYSETENENLFPEKVLIIKGAVMLIIMPLEMENINISDHFIHWKPGLLRLAIERHQVTFYTTIIKRYVTN